MEARKTQSYIIHEGRNVGPFSDADLRRFIAEGKLTEDAMLWREGFAEPLKVGSIAELHMLPSPSPSPVPGNPFLQAVPVQLVVPQQAPEPVVYYSPPSSDGLSDFLRTVAAIGVLVVGEMLVVQILSFRDAVVAHANEAKREQTSLAEGVIGESLQMYRVHNNKYPTTKQGLKALLSAPGKSKTWRGPYIESKKLKDLWGHPYSYQSDGYTYRIISPGMDGKLRTDDDIESSGGTPQVPDGSSATPVMATERAYADPADVAPTEVSPQTAEAAPSAKQSSMSVAELMVDFDRLVGTSVAVRGFVINIGEEALLYQEEGNMTFITLELSSLGREDRMSLMTKCPRGCNVIVTGIPNATSYEKKLVATALGSP